LINRFKKLRALIGRAASDPAFLRELAPLAFALVLSPWFYLAFKNYRDAAVYRDITMFNYAAFCIRKGERIYDTVATPDGPLIYWIEALFQSVYGVNDKVQRQLDLDFQAIIGMTIGVLLVPRAPVWKWLRRFVWAIVGAALWLGWVIESDFVSTVQRETYYVALGLLGLAFVYASEDRGVRLARVMLTIGGFLAGLQMFGKHSGIIYAALAVLTALLLRRERMSRFANVAWASAGVLLAVAFTFGYLLVFGSVRGFIFWYVHYDFEAYRFIRLVNASEVMSGSRVDIYAYAGAVLVVGVVGITTRVLPARSLAFALAPALCSAANVAQLHAWHYQLVPAVASTYLFYLYVLGLAWAPTRRGVLQKVSALGVAVVLMPLCMKQIMATPWLNPREKQIANGDIINPRAAGDFIAMHTRSTDRVLYYGGDPVAPFVAQRLPATPYIVRWLVDLTRQAPNPTDLDISHKPTPAQLAHINEMQAKLQNDACSRVINNPPAVMVFENTPGYPIDPLTDYKTFCGGLDELMKAQYFAAATFGDTRIFLRNDRP